MKTRYLKNVVKIEILAGKCTGCGMCIEVCPHEVIAISNRKAFLADRDACMECGACTFECPASLHLTQSFRVAKAKAMELRKK